MNFRTKIAKSLKKAKKAAKSAGKALKNVSKNAEEKKKQIEEWANVKSKQIQLKKLLVKTNVKVKSKEGRFKELMKYLKIAKKNDKAFDSGNDIEKKVTVVLYVLSDYKLQLKLLGNNMKMLKSKTLKADLKKIDKNVKDLEEVKATYKAKKDGLMASIAADRKKNSDPYEKNDDLDAAIASAKGHYDKHLAKFAKESSKVLIGVFEASQKYVNVTVHI